MQKERETINKTVRYKILFTLFSCCFVNLLYIIRTYEGSTENLHQTSGQPHGPLRRTPSLPRSYRQSGIPVLQRPTDNHCNCYIV